MRIRRRLRDKKGINKKKEFICKALKRAVYTRNPIKPPPLDIPIYYGELTRKKIITENTIINFQDVGNMGEIEIIEQALLLSIRAEWSTENEESSYVDIKIRRI